ncbi:hypothetical protein TYRP_023348 [Tyrophagus putrescentiae]|nr:hypothetical protein TYRP_023348 [Tyrophagus putrescentiae]
MLKTPGLGRRKQTKLPGKRHSTFPVETSQNSLNTKENDPAHSPSLSTSGNTLSKIEADVPPEIIDLLDDENNSMDVNSSDSFSDDVKQPKSDLESKDVHSDEPKVPTNLKQALSDDDDSNSKQTTKKRKISVANNISESSKANSQRIKPFVINFWKVDFEKTSFNLEEG